MATKTPLAEYAGTFRVMASGDTIPAAIVPTLNQNTTGNAATASRVPFFDTRAVNDQPSAIPGKSASYSFKNVASVDNPPVVAGDGYAHIGNYSGWESGGVGNGGFNTQVSYGDGLAVRQATSTTTWGPWRTVWDSGNFDPATKADASSLTSYLPLAGGTVTGTIDLSNTGNITYSDPGGAYIPRPLGGTYRTTAATLTGAIQIALPAALWPGTSDMVSFWVDVYDYATNETITVFVFGYAYGSAAGSWTNCGALILSPRTDRDFIVRFGHNGSQHVVTIGEVGSTWSYPQITVRDAQAGYSSVPANIDDGWGISFVTTLPTVIATSSNNYVVAKQLRTPRAINGTNFDGSAAITTANWGTARTITIGSTGKSVNGSGDVSWSLAEIGAIADAPSDGTTYGRKDGAWVAAGGGGITWSVSGSASTLAADTAQVVTAAVDKTLPATTSAGQQFIVHAKVDGVRIVSNGNLITGVGSGNALTLLAGETAYLVVSSAGNLEIV